MLAGMLDFELADADGFVKSFQPRQISATYQQRVWNDVLPIIVRSAPAISSLIITPYV